MIKSSYVFLRSKLIPETGKDKSILCRPACIVWADGDWYCGMLRIDCNSFNQPDPIGKEVKKRLNICNQAGR